MRNVKMTVVENVLNITIDLTQDHGVSRSGKSYTIACTDGNVPLIMDGVYRDEVMNLVVFKKRPQEEIDNEQVRNIEMLRKQWRDTNVVV